MDKRGYTERNSHVQPKTKMSDELSLTDLSGNPSFVIGNEVSALSTVPHVPPVATVLTCALSAMPPSLKVLYLPPNAGYKVCKPIKGGCLNVTPSQTLSCVLSQLEDLWTRAIEEYLDLPRKDFKVSMFTVFKAPLLPLT